MPGFFHISRSDLLRNICRVPLASVKSRSNQYQNFRLCVCKIPEGRLIIIRRLKSVSFHITADFHKPETKLQYVGQGRLVCV